jgi:HlyD family secretion protein
MKHWLWLMPLILITACTEKQEEVKLVSKQLTAAVYASGTLVPEEEYKVVSVVDGYLVHAAVREGDKVVKGQLLFKISNNVRETQKEGAMEVMQRTIPVALEGAPLVQELEGRIELARLKAREDSLQYIRYKNLYEKDITPKNTLERYYLQYQVSVKEYQSLQKQLRQQRITSGLQLQQAKNQLMVAAAQSDIGNLRSFTNGVVYDVYKKEGDLVIPNQPVALIGAGSMFAKLLVDEDDLDKVYTGQKVLITMDAFPEKVFKAHVAKVYPLLNKVEQSFRVDAVFDEPLPMEMYGLNIEANILIAENKSVLALPKTALLKGDSIMIKKDGKESKLKIKKGIEDDQWVEVIGMDSNTTVIIKQ